MGHPASTDLVGVLIPSWTMAKAGATKSVETAGRAAAHRMLVRYRDGGVSLESLISWAEALEASAPTDPWLRRAAQSLADPLLCRERAMAFVRDLLGE